MDIVIQEGDKPTVHVAGWFMHVWPISHSFTVQDNAEAAAKRLSQIQDTQDNPNSRFQARAHYVEALFNTNTFGNDSGEVKSRMKAIESATRNYVSRDTMDKLDQQVGRLSTQLKC